MNCDQTDSEQAAPIVTSSDLAFYVTLCSLATFDRNELRSRVLGSPTFRLILESEVICRDLLTTFYTAGYTKCLRILAEVKNLLKLDIFLSGRVNALYDKIRIKALCQVSKNSLCTLLVVVFFKIKYLSFQYFSPYVTADLNLMATAFSTTVLDLESELVSLIQNGSVNARIDSHKQVCEATLSILHIVC